MPNAEQARATLEARTHQRAERARQALARRHLIDFAHYVDPVFRDAPHLQLIAERLEAARRRETKRLMIFAPPRHGKSHLVTELFPAWALGIDPGEQFIVASHGASLANTFSRNVRNTLVDARYVELFPDTHLSADQATIQQWTLDGLERPAMVALGVGAAPTGKGARVLIIDDPIGNADEAESALARENLYLWYTDTIYPRLEPDAVIILMMQRWHEKDLAGRLLADRARADGWEVIMLPAIAETQSERDAGNAQMGLPSGLPDPVGRQPGEALWSWRYPVEALRKIEAVSKRSFVAKYQQRPRPPEGSLFKRAWLKTVPVASVPQNLRWVRYWDLAYSIKQSADNTASISGALGPDGTLYLRRGMAGKWESPVVRRKIGDTMRAEPGVQHGIESAVHGGATVQDMRRDPSLVAAAFRPVHVDTDKVSRATPVADRAEGGKVLFVREGPADDFWIEDWIDEMCAFPYGEHDDRVDAASGVALMLARPPLREAKSVQG